MGHRKRSPVRPLRRPPENANGRTAVAQLCQQPGRERHPRSRGKGKSELPDKPLLHASRGESAVVQGDQQPHSLKKTSKSPEELLQRASDVESEGSAMAQPHQKQERQRPHPNYHGKVNLSESREEPRKRASCGNSGEAAMAQPYQQEDRQRRLRSHSKGTLSESPEESLQNASLDVDSGGTRTAPRYRLGLWLEYGCILTVFLIFAGGLVTSEHEVECLRRDGLVSDMNSRLLDQRLTNQLEEKDEEIDRLKSRENEWKRMKQMYEDDTERRVKEFQTYLQGQEGRLQKQIQGLKSQVDDKEMELAQMRESSSEQVEKLHSCREDVQSKGSKIQDLKNEHASEVEQLRQEQKHKLNEKDEKISELQAVIQHLERELQKEQECKYEELEEKDKEMQNQNGTVQALINAVHNEKRKRESEVAQCERILESLRSAQNDASWWDGLKFVTGVGVGGAICSMSKMASLASAGGLENSIKLW